MSRRPLPCLLLLLVVVLSAPAAAAQNEEEVNCDSICMLPLRPPSDCVCGSGTVTSGPAGGGRPPDTIEPDWGPPGSGGQLLREVVEGYEAQLATITDYTVVASVAGSPPVVLYYEKVLVDYPGRSAHPIMQLVQQDELTRRQGEGSGAPTPEQLLGALGAVGPYLAEQMGNLPTGGLPAEVRGHLTRLRFGLTVLPALLDGIADGPQDQGPAYDHDVFWDPMFLGIMIQYAREGDPEVVGDQLVRKLVITSRDFDFSELTEMDVTRITLWIAHSAYQQPVPLRMRIEGWYGVDRVEIERQWDGRAWVGPMSKSLRLVDIIRGLRGQTSEAVTEIDQVLVNQGLPTSEETARLIREALERRSRQ